VGQDIAAPKGPKGTHSRAKMDGDSKVYYWRENCMEGRVFRCGLINETVLVIRTERGNVSGRRLSIAHLRKRSQFPAEKKESKQARGYRNSQKFIMFHFVLLA
jgi:hypothetical protein